MSSNVSYRSRAVRALVLLHEEHLRRFAATWRQAVTTSVRLPASADPAYASLDALGRHVFGAAGGYLAWICKVLALPAATIRPVPDAAEIRRDAEPYLEHVLEQWRGGALREVADEQLETPEYASSWQTRYSIDAMLEHAVMHPIRHTFQLQELMRDRETQEQGVGPAGAGPQ